VSQTRVTRRAGDIKNDGLGQIVMTTLSDHGIISLSSRISVHATADRLSNILESRGMTLFARIDQQAAARTANLKMNAMILLVFGNPKAGTPLMQKYPSLAIDLPLKALAWEDETGQAWVSYNSPEYLQKRHGLPDAPFQVVETLIAESVL
jgi:uncharacterized protein (DUF302 family)